MHVAAVERSPATIVNALNGEKTLIDGLPEPSEQIRERVSARLEPDPDETQLAERILGLEYALSAERTNRRRYQRMLGDERARREELEEELESARKSVAFLERQVQLVWNQSEWAERLWADRPLWRKLLRRPPARR